MGTIFVGGHLLGALASGNWPQFGGHLFLIKSDDASPSDDDKIIRVGPENQTAVGTDPWGQMVLQTNISYGGSEDDPEVWKEKNGNPQNPDQYWGYTALDMTGLPDFGQVWKTLVDLANQIDAYNIDYDLINQNSNSFVATLLAVLGKAVPDIISANGQSYVYPGAESPQHLLSHDWVGGATSLYTYKIHGNSLDDLGNKVGDSLHAIDWYGGPLLPSPGDSLWGFQGDDKLYGGVGRNILVGGADRDFLDGGRNHDTLVGGDFINREHPTDGEDVNVDDINIRVYHPEWNDGSADQLAGGYGVDTYLISHEQAAFVGSLTDALDVIDVIDETKGDGLGLIKIQNHRIYDTPSGPVEETTSIASSGIFEIAYQGDDGTHYYNTSWSNEQTETDWTTSIIVSNVLDENGNPYVYLVPEYPNFGAPYVAIKGFRQGDFGIYLQGYVGPKEGTDGDDIILNDGSGGLLRAGSASTDDITLNSDPDSDQRIDAGGGNDVVYGRGGQDELRGGDGDDQLFGGDDDDLMTGGDGDDYLNGGDGDDVAAFALSRSEYSISFVDGHLIVAGSGSSDTLIDIETLRFADGDFSASDFMINHIDGTAGDDVLDGSSGSDQLNGLAGNDTISGSDGADILIGGVGNDSLDGGVGADVYIYASGDGNDTIVDNAIELNDVDVLRFSDLNLDDLSFSQDGEALLITVNATGNVITVNAQHYNAGQGWSLERLEFADGTSLTLDHSSDTTWIEGTSGADTIAGTSGKDYIRGGTGDDLLNGDAGGDVYLYSRGDGNDTINDGTGFTDNIDVLRLNDLNASDLLFSRSGADLIINIGGTSDFITVQDQFHAADDPYWGIDRIEFADGTSWSLEQIRETTWIKGTNGSDTLSGTSTFDVLDGGAGDDTLQGGGDSDTFIFRGSFGHDTITDFVAGEGSNDIIDTDAFADFASVLAAATQIGDDTLITADANNSILLKNIAVANLHQDDFRFSAAA